eukprot:821988-Alexandrium_andersonii.AAC.1
MAKSPGQAEGSLELQRAHACSSPFAVAFGLSSPQMCLLAAEGANKLSSTTAGKGSAGGSVSETTEAA